MTKQMTIVVIGSLRVNNEPSYKEVSVYFTRHSVTYSTLVKFSEDDILKYFSYFSQKTGSDMTICMKCRILFLQL